MIYKNIYAKLKLNIRISESFLGAYNSLFSEYNKYYESAIKNGLSNKFVLKLESRLENN